MQKRSTSLLLALLIGFSSPLLAKSNTPYDIYKSAYEAYSKEPSSKNALALGEASLLNGATEQAQNIARSLLSENPKNNKAKLLLAKSYIAQNRFLDAGNLLSKLLSTHPEPTIEQEALKLGKSIATKKYQAPKITFFQLKAGIDSNPAFTNQNTTQLNEYYTTLTNCYIGSGSCDYSTATFNSKADAFLDYSAQSRAVYDVFGKGGFFLKYGWSLDGRLYASSNYANFSLALLHGGLGYRGFWGALTFDMSIGAVYNDALKATPNMTSGILFTSSVDPKYRYYFGNGSSIYLGGGFSEYQDRERNTTDQSGNTYTTQPRIMFNSFEVGYRSASSVKGYWALRFIDGEINFENVGGWIEYADSRLKSIIYETLWRHNAIHESHIVFELTQRRFWNPPIQGDSGPSDPNYDYDKDPLNLLRTDYTLRTNYEWRNNRALYRHTAYGLTFYANSSKYTPQNYLKLELYYAYRW